MTTRLDDEVIAEIMELHYGSGVSLKAIARGMDCEEKWLANQLAARKKFGMQKYQQRKPRRAA